VHRAVHSTPALAAMVMPAGGAALLSGYPGARATVGTDPTTPRQPSHVWQVRDILATPPTVSRALRARSLPLCSAATTPAVGGAFPQAASPLAGDRLGQALLSDHVQRTVSAAEVGAVKSVFRQASEPILRILPPSSYRGHSEVEDLRIQLKVLAASLPQVEVAVSQLCEEFRGLEHQQKVLAATFQAETMASKEAEDRLAKRCDTLEVMHAEFAHHSTVREELLGATQSAMEWLRQDVSQNQANLFEEKQQLIDKQGRRIEEVSQDLLRSQRLLHEGQEKLKEEQKRLAGQCARVEELAQEQQAQKNQALQEQREAKLGKQGAEPVKPVFIHFEDLQKEVSSVCAQRRDLQDLQEEVSSVCAQQQLHTLLLESLRTDVMWLQQRSLAASDDPQWNGARSI